MGGGVVSLKPYYADESVTLLNADAMDVLRSLPDASVDLVATDPPYFRVKDEPWDRAWDNADGFLAWLSSLCVEWRRVLKPNGSLYVFASPEMERRVAGVVEASFRVLNVIRWQKEEGWHNKTERETLRSFLSPWEAVIFAEHPSSDTLAADTSGYYTATNDLRRRIYAPLGEYFRHAREAAGLTRNDAEVALGFVSSGDATKGTALYTRWEEGNSLPTAETYARLRLLVGVANAPKEYAALRHWFDEELRQQYEELRRPFDLRPKDQAEDIWNFGTVSPYPGKHVCEKPIALMEHIVRTSTRPGAVVLDTFVGSGTTAEAARNLGRRAIVADASSHWCEWTRRRLSQNVLDLGAA